MGATARPIASIIVLGPPVMDVSHLGKISLSARDANISHQ